MSIVTETELSVRLAITTCNICFRLASMLVLLSFLVTVKAAPHECVNRTGLL